MSLPTQNSSPTTRTNRHSLFMDLGIPTLCVILPMTLLSAGFIGLVIYGWRQIGPETLFENVASSNKTTSNFILVDISNSWLLSLSSVSSTLAGLMPPVVMMIQMYRNAQAMQKNSVAAQHSLATSDNLPTPYQVSLMLGLGTGNPERLWRYEKYSRATSNDVPAVMRRTALILKLCLVLSLALFVADQSLHYTTRTVQIEQATAVEKMDAFGRGLSHECLSMNREQNEWEPCSLDASRDAFQTQTAQNQMHFLQQGLSNVSTIELVNTVPDHENPFALVIPAGVRPSTDYRASTIGVSAQCESITSECAMTATGLHQGYTSFNCSDQFWGVLNKAPLTSTNVTLIDPDVPPLSLKWSQNLQTGFFMDKALSVPYNSLGLNPSTGLNDLDMPGLPDSDLINPVYYGIAGSLALTAQLAGVNLGTDSEIYVGYEYLSFALRCSYQTFEVEYTSSNARLRDFDITPTKNGSIAEIYHGYISSFSLSRILSLGSSETATQFQGILSTATLASSAANLAEQWANLHSKQILSVVGAFTSPRGNLKEQSRNSILVTKLPIPALAVLLTLNLVYLPLGLYLFTTAYRRASKSDIRDLFARLSLPGVITSFFDSDSDTRSSQGTSRCGFDERKILYEATHVEAVLNEKDEYRLQPAWHGV